MDTLDENANNITFFFEDTDVVTGEDNSLELEKMMQEFELEDNKFISLNETDSLNDLSYFIKKNFYSGNDEYYYNEESHYAGW